jgi:hypothetical protein
VCVRVLGIVVIDRRPFDGPSEVALDAVHQLAHVVGEVEVACVLRRDDEAELMAFVQARLLERLPRDGTLGSVEHARRAVLLDAVPLDVPKVPGRRLRAVPSELLDVRLDDDAAGVRPRAKARTAGQPRRLGTQAPVTAAHERRDAHRARGDPFARAIGATDARSKGTELLVGVVPVAHRRSFQCTANGAANTAMRAWPLLQPRPQRSRESPLIWER